MKYDIIPRGHGQPIFVAKLGGHWLDEIKQAFATGRDIGTVLDIVGRPEAFGRGIVALVEQRIKRFQHEILVFLFGAHCLLLLFVICWVEGRVGGLNFAISHGDELNFCARHATRAFRTRFDVCAAAAAFLRKLVGAPSAALYDQFGKLSPNIGSPLFDPSRVASSWITSQCSASWPFSMRTMSTTIQATGA